MTKSKKRRLIFVLIVAILATIVIIDSLKIFDDSPYVIVSHGNHVHYLPHDRDPAVPLDAFPTEKPRPGERIMPNGQVVREDPTSISK
jgi:hypothetical protein